jgi:hypothetical protein
MNAIGDPGSARLLGVELGAQALVEEPAEQKHGADREE